MTDSPDATAGWTPDRDAHSPRSRVERVISVGRLVIVLCWGLAFRIDPPAAADHAPIVLAVIAGYFLYLVAVVAYVWTGHAPAPRWRVADQALDGSLGFVLLSLTGGTAGPFFSYLSFSVLFATLRWQWRGALAVGVPTTLAFVARGVAETLSGMPQLASNMFIMQTAYLGALTGLLCYLGIHHRGARRTITRVATWTPPSIVTAPHVEPLLRSAAAVLGVPRAVLAWTERGEDALQLAFLTDGEVIGRDYEDWTPDALVADDLARVDFLSLDVAAPASTLTCLADGRLDRRWAARAVPAEIQQQFAMRAVIAVRLEAPLVHGRLFLLDMPDMTADDLVMAGLLARQIGSRLEDRILARQLAATAAAEERVGLARDVHDGALQSLAGMRLQLEAARRLIVARPDEAEGILLEIQDVVAAEQHSLRRMISRLQRVEPGEAEPDQDLADRVTALVLRIERQWNVRVVFSAPVVHQELDALLPVGLAEELYQVLREALVNAARHARARTVTVAMGIEGDAVQVTVHDDGEGFPFTGRYDLPRLTRLDMGPAVLRKRVAALGGALTIDSSRHGARLEISIPLEPPPRLSVPAASTER